jgi:hypothetical protein
MSFWSEFDCMLLPRRPMDDFLDFFGCSCSMCNASLCSLARQPLPSRENLQVSSDWQELPSNE